jgi:D-methionine transport system substrate-binding protein
VQTQKKEENMKKKILSLGICVALAATMVMGCSGSSEESEETTTETKEKITIGTSSVAVDMANSGVEYLEGMGYEVEVIVFDDYFLPNEALVEGEIDANLYQHEPFLDSYNEENGTDIIMLEPKLWNYWSGIYSVKADTIEDLPDGGKVALGEDASNISLDLQKLDSVGIITLTDEEKDLYDIADIVENPHNYEFVTADHTKYLNMEDYTLLVGSSNTMASYGVDPTEHLLKSFFDESVCHGMCILPENEDAQWVKDLMEAYTSDEAKAAIPESAGFIAEF